MPSLANNIDLTATSTSSKSKSPSEAVHLPSIHRQQSRRLSQFAQHPYGARHAPTTPNAARIFARKRPQKQQQNTTHTLPRVENIAKFTSKAKVERQWH